jgi:hypothetical protein
MNRTRSLILGLVAAALLVVAVPTALASSAGAQVLPGTCPATVVQRAELVRTVNGPRILVVGIKPHADTRVRLEAEQVVYVQQPDYWRYFAAGCGGTGIVAKFRYSVLLPVPTGPVGRYGIEIGPSVIDL